MYYLLGGVTLSRLKFKNKYIKIIVMSLCLILPLGLGSIIYKLNSKVSEIEAIKIDEDDQIKQQYQLLLQNLFDYRNKAILEQNEEILKELYDTDKKTGLWAYEHEVEKMKYLKNWSSKQGVTFNDIKTKVKIRKVKEKETDLYGIICNVATDYNYFYERNISVDMIPVDADFSQYKMVVAPVLYMVKEGMKEALESFVKNGGILITTYMSGIVDQSDNVHLGGYPGPLRDMAGVWVEEIDALAPEQVNEVKFADGTTASCNLLCDLLHLEGAEALATYQKDFYADMPAVTRNTFGKGATYYVGTQMDDAGLAKILDQAVNEVNVRAVIPEVTGLEVTCRTSDDTRYYYVMNFKDEDQVLPDSLSGKTDLISGEVIPAGTVLKKWDVLILQEAR